ncbi:palmitoyltransferase ZDHHC20-B-like isoform X3 [Leptopilina heterotoma]|uniref:palmitoyltransferase ZDHHC20-B-like isoform X3 n=1 Tax=Leptopilina heterotoma TaxID=63436 RepID=UPI001CA7FED3|nr:palmitoyltransferase ZDHHC20-B-like isoform X3 [Leptopilina heterotoma]
MSKQNGSCWWCLKAVKWIPVIFILTTVGWSYYAYIVQFCFYTLESAVQRVFYLIFFHALFAMFTWSYCQTVFTELTPIPDKFKIPAVEMEKLLTAETEDIIRQILDRLAQDLPITNRTVKGVVRYCEQCYVVKPDRAHHCSVCGTCVLKMDHHCPWVNNCVGFHNYKFFMLFLAYAFLYCTFITATTLEYFVRFWKNDLHETVKFHVLFLFFIAIMFAVSLNSLFFYHCYLILRNRSTLEAYRPPMFRSGQDKNAYSLGKYNNFQEVFGDNTRLWFLPIFTSLGNGVNYPLRLQDDGAPNSYNSMGNTQNRSALEEMSMVQEATILALGAGTAVLGPSVEVSQRLVDPADVV